VQVCVVGGGVVGLTTAVSLLDAGHEVEVLAATRTPGTTSDVAAAIFYPFLAHPKERVEMWARASRQVFEILAEDPATGVRLDEIVELFTIVGPPAEHLPEPRLLTTGLPPGYASAWATRLPVIDMARYLPWLEAECRNRGGVIRTRRLERLVEAPGDVVVHCTGLGARQLVGDARIRPMRGQVARLANPGLTRVWLDQRLDHLAYVVPFPDRVVVGGTAEPDEWDDAPQSEVEALILRRGALLEPSIAHLPVTGRAVGLRPYRDEVRLEASRLADGRGVVHNYGHGGSGVTLSWGCAREAVVLVDRSY
jgi:D-amino-acid oxidase